MDISKVFIFCTAFAIWRWFFFGYLDRNLSTSVQHSELGMDEPWKPLGRAVFYFRTFYMVIPVDTSSRTPLGHYFLWFCMNGIQFPTDHSVDPFQSCVCVCGCACVWCVATPATQNEGHCHQVIWLARKVPRRPRRQTGTKRVTRASPVPQVPRLPRKVKVDVAKCHACHAKRRSLSPSDMVGTQSAAATTASNGNQARHQSQPSAISATPATQSEGRCCQVPRLPCKTKVTVPKWYGWHAKCRGDHGIKRKPSASPEPAQCHKSHACHAKWRSMSPSATLATQDEGHCHQVPPLPRKVPRRPRRQTGTKRVASASPVP